MNNSDNQQDMLQIFKTVLDLTHILIAYLDSDFNFLWVNRAYALADDKEPAFFPGKNHFDLFPNEENEAIFSGVVESGEPYSIFSKPFEYPENPERGTSYWDWNLVPLKDSGGEVISLILTLTDVTRRTVIEEERLQLEARLAQAQKLESLSVLAGGIAHDFNNLLVGVLGNADLALNVLPTSSPAVKNLQGIEKSARRAAELSSQMLAFAGKGKFVIQQLDISTVVAEMKEVLKIYSTDNVALRYDLGVNLPVIEADSNQLYQIVTILVQNASEAIGDEGGTISIKTGSRECDQEFLSETFLDDNLTEGLYAVLEVSDDGCGMDEEIQARIFDPFFSSKFQGRGLGLAATLGIVRSHSGAIKVDSEQGKGTSVTIFFPSAGGQVAGKTPDQSKDDNWQGSGTILVVDDDESVREAAGDMLMTMGFEVLSASNGQEGVEIFRQFAEKIEVVLLDMTMPVMGGNEAFQKIREIREDARVILSSGFNEQEVINKIEAEGLAGFLKKPYQLSGLQKIIREVLDS